MVTKIICVCNANMGRSPALAAYMNHFAKEMDTDIMAESAGAEKNFIAGALNESYKNRGWITEKDIADRYRKPIPEKFLGSKYTIVQKDVFDILMEEGVYEIIGHTPILFTKELGEQSDLILTADSKNKSSVLEIYPHKSKVFTAMEYADMIRPDIIDAHLNPTKSTRQEYRDGIMKGTPEAFQMMCAECRDVALSVVGTLLYRNYMAKKK